MLDRFLTAALERLDGRLLAVCDAEERRAALLAGDGRGGWDGVKNLARPSLTALSGSVDMTEPLLSDDSHPLNDIKETLRLEDCEIEAVLVVFAGFLEPRYQSLYAVLQDDLRQNRPTERLLLTVAGGTAARRARLHDSLSRGGRLGRSGLITTDPGSFPPLGRPLSLPDDVLAVLTGTGTPGIGGAVRQSLLPGRAKSIGSSQPACLLLHGRGDHSEMCCALVPQDSRVLHVRVPAGAAAEAVCQAAWRTGLTTGDQPMLDLCDLDEEQQLAMTRNVIAWTTDLGGRAWISVPAALPVTIRHLECPLPSWPERIAGWGRVAAKLGLSLTEAEVQGFAMRYRLEPEAVWRLLTDRAVTDATELDRIVRELVPGTVQHSVRRDPVSTLDDLVLRDTTRTALERLIFYASHRDRIAAERGLHSRYRLDAGPLALFSGRSGTGKTVAAEAIATALRIPLHTVDLSRLISKYIGDTEKHIDEALSESERTPAVLFFDEADVLFSSRVEKASSGGEHFANMVVGYLLQRMERHDGVVILATNLRHAIDEAFLRRFQFRIEFPLPESDERRQIWELLLPLGVTRGTELDLPRIAATYRLSGGEIRNAALRAIFLAEREAVPLAARHVDEAIAVELLELGRLSRRFDHAFGAEFGLDDPLDRDCTHNVDRGHLLRATGELLENVLEPPLRRLFRKEIHLVQGSPTERTLAGRRPAISIALFRLAGRRGAAGLRAGFIISAWSNRAEEELELVGLVHETLSRINSAPLLGTDAVFRVQESHDFDLLHRFWSSHDHPLRPSVVVDIEVDGTAERRWPVALRAAES